MILSSDKTQFAGATDLREDVENLQTPLQFFKYLQIKYCHIVEQTMIYSAQQCQGNPIKVSNADIESFIGLCMNMSLISNCRYYWSTQFCVNQVANIMTYNAFMKLKRFIHFSNNALQMTG